VVDFFDQNGDRVFDSRVDVFRILPVSANVFDPELRKGAPVRKRLQQLESSQFPRRHPVLVLVQRDFDVFGIPIRGGFDRNEGRNREKNRLDRHAIKENLPSLVDESSSASLLRQNASSRDNPPNKVVLM